MCAHAPSVPDAPASNDSLRHDRSEQIEAALKELAEALSARKVDPICTAYLALRRAMSVREILEHLNGAADGSAEQMLISAFSHQRCFMCEDGTVPCRTCEGTGEVDRFPCPGCDGLGLEVCPFCLGTGWSDAAELPDEIRRPAIHRRIKHLENELARLAKVTEADVLASAGQLSDEQRRELISRLIRLQARLTNPPKTESDSNTEQAAHFAAIAARIDRILKTLQENGKTETGTVSDLGVDE